MKAFNAVDRKNSFLFFILFYVLTTAVIVIACFFGMSNPGKENERLQAEVEKLEKNNDFGEDFSNKMVTLKLQLDSLKTGGNEVIVRGRIDAIISELSGKIAQANIPNKDYYNKLIEMSQQLKETIINNKQIAGSVGDASKILEQLKQKENELTQTKMMLENYKATHP